MCLLNGQTRPLAGTNLPAATHINLIAQIGTNSSQPQQQSQRHPEIVSSSNTHQHWDYVELSADKSNWDCFSKSTVPPVVPQNSSRQASPKKADKLPAQRSPDSGHSSSKEILESGSWQIAHRKRRLWSKIHATEFPFWLFRKVGQLRDWMEENVQWYFVALQKN